jgi:predicted kinase
MNRRVYDGLRAAADGALARGRSMILDATFRRPEDRDSARALAARHSARFVLVECSAPGPVLRFVLSLHRGRIIQAPADRYPSMPSRSRRARWLDDGGSRGRVRDDT